MLSKDKLLINANQYFNCEALKLETADLKSIEGLSKVIEDYNKTFAVNN
jgi:hypothetical protein